MYSVLWLPIYNLFRIYQLEHILGSQSNLSPFLQFFISVTSIHTYPVNLLLATTYQCLGIIQNQISYQQGFDRGKVPLSSNHITILLAFLRAYTFAVFEA